MNTKNSNQKEEEKQTADELKRQHEELKRRNAELQKSTERDREIIAKVTK